MGQKQVTQLNAFQETVMALRERVMMLSERMGGEPLIMERLTVKCRTEVGVRDYFQIQNLFVDDMGGVCADWVAMNDKSGDGVMFGKSLEDLPLEDLQMILGSLYRGTWAPAPEDEQAALSSVSRRPLDSLRSVTRGFGRRMLKGA